MSLGERRTYRRGVGGVGDLAWPLRRAASLFGGSDAIIDRGRRITYDQLAQRVAAFGAGIEGLGVSEGGRIGYLGVNSLPHVECWFGVPAAGRVLVDLNFRLAESELAFIVDDCGIEALIVDGDRLMTARLLRSRCQTLAEIVLTDQESGGGDVLPCSSLVEQTPAEYRARAPDELAGICYTGGTTGAPKGVMLSHGNLLENARHNLIITNHSPEHRWLHVPPMFHVAGTSNVFACTWAGSAQVTLDRFDARSFIDTVRRESITHCALVPTMLSMVLDELKRESPKVGLPSLRHIQYAASPITSALQREVLDYFDCDIAQFYGMTEAAPTVTHLSPQAHRLGASGVPRHAKRLASVGTPVIGVETAVLGADGSWLPSGEVGELCVRGPNIMLGYWNREEATETALRDGWYHTGDAVSADDEGYLYLVDRLKDMIITGGENVYSVEVEAALAEHPAVAEVAVFGIPEARWGEAVHAVVTLVPDASLSGDELIEHCRPRIASYKIPRSIELRSEPLPKSGPGKILKGDLRDPFWAGYQRRVN